MKKLVILSASAGLLALAACSDNDTQIDTAVVATDSSAMAPAATETTVVTDTAVVSDTAAADAANNAADAANNAADAANSAAAAASTPAQ